MKDVLQDKYLKIKNDIINFENNFEQNLLSNYYKLESLNNFYSDKIYYLIYARVVKFMTFS